MNPEILPSSQRCSPLSIINHHHLPVSETKQHSTPRRTPHRISIYDEHYNTANSTLPPALPLPQALIPNANIPTDLNQCKELPPIPTDPHPHPHCAPTAAVHDAMHAMHLVPLPRRNPHTAPPTIILYEPCVPTSRPCTTSAPPHPSPSALTPHASRASTSPSASPWLPCNFLGSPGAAPRLVLRNTLRKSYAGTFPSFPSFLLGCGFQACGPMR